MCLGVPGQIIEINRSDTELPMGKVSFGGLAKEVCLAYVPDVVLGEYVLVHAGFAITKLDEEHAAELFRYLSEMEELAGIADASLAAAEGAGAGATPPVDVPPPLGQDSTDP